MKFKPGDIVATTRDSGDGLYKKGDIGVFLKLCLNPEYCVIMWDKLPNLSCAKSGFGSLENHFSPAENFVRNPHMYYAYVYDLIPSGTPEQIKKLKQEIITAHCVRLFKKQRYYKEVLLPMICGE